MSTSPFVHRLPSRASALALMAVLTFQAHAGPGAHGPNGEHLDGPVATAGTTASTAPKLEANSEDFELVATLSGGELSVLVDRYETNEPVHNGQLEVESGGLKAAARFHADHGDYAFDDPKLLAELAKPGKHPLVFTLTAGEQADLLEGVLVVQQAVDMSGGHDHAAETAHGHSHDSAGGHTEDRHHAWLGPVGVAAAAVALLGLIAWIAMRRDRRQASKIKKG
jgi:hypothetical protein